MSTMVTTLCRLVVELGRVDAESAATNSQWVFQTSVDVTLLFLLRVDYPSQSTADHVTTMSTIMSTQPGTCNFDLMQRAASRLRCRVSPTIFAKRFSYVM
jgi:hypothetical protein